MRPLWHIDYLNFQKTELRHLEKPGTVNHSTLAPLEEDKGQLSNTVNNLFSFLIEPSFSFKILPEENGRFYL